VLCSAPRSNRPRTSPRWADLRLGVPLAETSPWRNVARGRATRHAGSVHSLDTRESGIADPGYNNRFNASTLQPISSCAKHRSRAAPRRRFRSRRGRRPGSSCRRSRSGSRSRGGSRRCRDGCRCWCRASHWRHSNKIDVLFVLSPAGVKVVCRRIGHVASGVIRHNSDVIGYVVLAGSAFQGSEPGRSHSRHHVNVVIRRAVGTVCGHKI